MECNHPAPIVGRDCLIYTDNQYVTAVSLGWRYDISQYPISIVNSSVVVIICRQGNSMKSGESGIRAKFINEMKTMFVVFIYLAALLGAFTLYRRLVLDVYQISYFHYGYNFIEALVLSKVIVFGSAFGLGERFRHRPLIYVTLYKTFCFSLFVLAFSILEHLIGGWIHGKSSLEVWNAILAQGMWEILAHVQVLVLAFLPLFAIWEMGRVLGEGKLFEMFFGPSGKNTVSPDAIHKE